MQRQPARKRSEDTKLSRAVPARLRERAVSVVCRARYVVLGLKSTSDLKFAHFCFVGKLQVLLLQDQIYYPLLQGFLKSTDYPRISWLHDVAIGDFHSATTTLSEEVGNESKVDARQVSSSTHQKLLQRDNI